LQFQPTIAPTTGELSYDESRFSAEPIGEVLSQPGAPIQAVRHIGVRNVRMAGLFCRRTRTDTLILNTNTPGALIGHCHGQRVDGSMRRGMISFVPVTLGSMLEFPAETGFVELSLARGALAGMTLRPDGTLQSPLFLAENDRVTQLASMIVAEIQNPGFGSDMVVDSLMRVIANLLSRCDPRGIEPPSQRIRLAPAKLRRVTDYVEANLSRQISLDEIAALVGLSPFHFARMFKAALGETPARYVLARRLTRTRDLLRDGRWSLAAIALECGFASQSHFTAAFTRESGLSPGRFRREAADILPVGTELPVASRPN